MGCGLVVRVEAICVNRKSFENKYFYGNDQGKKKLKKVKVNV